MKKMGAAAVFVAVAIIVVGCGGGSSTAPHDPSGRVAPVQEGSGAAPREVEERSVVPAPDFTVTLAGAVPYTLSQQRGKVVVLYFSFPG